jgi:hypothetical protein
MSDDLSEGKGMSMNSSANQLLEEYAARNRTNNPKTDPVRLQKQSALQRYGDHFFAAAVRAFVRAAVTQFAMGNLREARYFYNGAFAFGNRDMVRRLLCRFSLAAAKQALRDGEHQTIWRLLAAIHAYPPDDMTPSDVNSLFTQRGIPLGALRPVVDEPPIVRLRNIGAQLPATAFAAV